MSPLHAPIGFGVHAVSSLDERYHKVVLKGLGRQWTAREAVFGVLVALSALSVPVAGAQGPTSAEADTGARDGAEHRGFTFSPGTCELGQEFCGVSTPRSWSAAETEVVRTALDAIAASDLGRRIISRAHDNGFRRLRRFARTARLSGGRYEPQPMTVAMLHTDDDRARRSIDITDRFFERGSARDHFSGEPGYLLTAEILAHELVHALDLDQRYSGTFEFRRVARLGMTAAQQQEADRVNGTRERLIAEGQYESDWRASRSFAIVTLRGRLPSLHALDGYREAFAEFGAHLVLDPHARRQFEPRLIQYVDQAVSGSR
jgi:hypothetical protein